MYALSLFGPVTIEQDGLPLSGLRSRKAVALLAYVVAHRQPVPRSQLAELFWPGAQEKRSLANLRWVLSHLAKHLPDALNIQRHTVTRGARLTCDLHLFRQQIQHNTIASLAQADDLYQGEFMAGFAVDAGPEFELWLATEREHWQQQALQVAATLAYHAGTQDNAPLAIQRAHRWLALAPWHEEAHRWLMYWLAATGQQQAALRQYALCRARLAEELGVAPSAETEALHAEIARDTAESDFMLPLPSVGEILTPLPLAAHNLPRQLENLVGRAAELTYIAARLADANCGLVTLVGPGGIGKSRLALEAAHAQAANFADGVWLVPLTGTASVQQLPAAIAHALSLSLSSAHDLRRQLLQHLSSKQALLVLDNFEHLLEGVELIDAILRYAPQVKILVTSREYLHHQAEWIVDVGGLTMPPASISHASMSHADEVGSEVMCYGAVQLFVECAQRTHARFTLTPANLPYVVQICRHVDGMPLGIKLAAAWVRTRSCAEIAAEIAHNLDFRTLSPHGLPKRHQSLRAVVDSAWQRLTEQEQRVMAKLSLFRCDFDASAARAVADASLTILARLVEQSLLQVERQPRRLHNGHHALPRKRFSLHALLGQYGLEKLAACGNEEEARAAHAHHYLTWLAAQFNALVGPQPQATLRNIDLEIENLRPAWQWAIEQGAVLGGVFAPRALQWVMAALPAFSLYLDYRTRLEEGVQLFGMAASRWQGAVVDREHDREHDCEQAIAYAKVLGYYGLYLFRFERSHEAAQVLGDSLAIARECIAHAELTPKLAQEAREVQAFALYVLGYNAKNAGSTAKGESYLRDGLALAEQVDNPWLVVKLLYALGWLLSEQGRTVEGGAALEQAVTQARALSDRRAEAHARYYLGELRLGNGDFAQARACFEESLRDFQQLAINWGIAQAEYGLLLVAFACEEYAETRRLCEQVIPRYEKIKAHADFLEQVRAIYAHACASDTDATRASFPA